jgi:hypothetical protein
MVRSQVYSGEAQSLFQELGIDSSREAEVYHMCRLESGLHLYGGWLHCVGRIEEEGEKVGASPGGIGAYNYYFHEKPVVVPAPFQGLPLLQLEFIAEIPWVLQEPEPE